MQAPAKEFIMRLTATLSFILLSAAFVGCDSNSKSSKPTISSQSPSSSSSASANPQPVALLGDELDKKLNNIMQKSGATAATFAVAKEGAVIYQQAYGFKDINQRVSLNEQALMRAASTTKPMTAAAIKKLAENDVLELSDHVFCTGDNAPCWLAEDLLSSTSDSRVKDIAIEHLLQHQGGWYRDISGDPLTKEVEIRDFLGLQGPPTQDDIIRYVMNSPLDYTPGTADFEHDAYSNFGYAVLGKIIELASQSSFIEYVHTALTDPLGINPEDLKLGASRLVDHDIREPHYISDEMCPSVYEVGQTARCLEEGAEASNWVGDGGLITTAGSLALFAQHFRLPANYQQGYGVIGEPISNPSAYGAHGGLLPGSSAMVRQLPTGESYALLLNVSYYMEGDLAELDRISQLPLE